MSRVHGFLLLCALAVLAACGQRIASGPSAIPQLQTQAPFVDGRLLHAPCTIVPALHSPVDGKPSIATAFGQLVISGAGVRSAFAGVEFEYHGGKRVLAANAGRAAYFPNLSGYGQAIVVKSKSGTQTLYTGFARPVPALRGSHVTVKAGETIAHAGTAPLRFEYAPAGNVLAAGTQSNPCGSGSSASSGTISVMPADVAVYARFHALALDGTPLPVGAYPAGSPDVATPAELAVANVLAPHAAAGSVYEHSDVFSSFYVVLCGNVVFATGPARYQGPFPYPNPTASSSAPLVTPSLPPLVFFRDPGRLGKSLVKPLPSPYGRACPAPAPANIYVFGSETFNEAGQTRYVIYWANSPAPGTTPPANDTVTFSSSNTGVVTMDPASPSPLPVFSTEPPPWPPPSPRAEMRAIGVGSATITVVDASCPTCDAPISVTVNPTPTPAPIPTPISN
jgi:hypothetical protein